MRHRSQSRSRSRSPSPHRVSKRSITHITPNIKRVRQEISDASKKYQIKEQPRLLAVSKTHPHDAVLEAYDTGQRHFGENYVAELLEKAPLCPPDIKWHFIGHLQSNKAKNLVSLPNLALIESVDSINLAQKLNQACEKIGRTERLNILVQVNTSEEESKFGCTPETCLDIVSYVYNNCKSLNIKGLMTIGRFEVVPNPQYFSILNKCKEDILLHYPTLSDGFELSMGMSHDYDAAIQQGSTQLRIGTAIFGKRDYAASKPNEQEQAIIDQRNNNKDNVSVDDNNTTSPPTTTTTATTTTPTDDITTTHDGQNVQSNQV